MEEHDVVDELVEGFIFEHLARNPEYIDVVEYVDENFLPEDEPEDMDNFLASIYQRIVTSLDTISQTYADRNS